MNSITSRLSIDLCITSKPFQGECEAVSVKIKDIQKVKFWNKMRPGHNGMLFQGAGQAGGTEAEGERGGEGVDDGGSRQAGRALQVC